MAETYTREDPGCLCLPEWLADSRDFKAEEVIALDRTIKLPKHFTLGKRIHKTNYQNWWGSCTANATSHGVQVLNVMQWWVEPTEDNIITPDRKDLRTNMWHNLKDKNDSWDYVENAVSTALKNLIKNEDDTVSKYDGYSVQDRARNEKWIETIKRYIYNNNPIVWCLRWNKTTWTELTKWQLKTFIPVEDRTGGHAVAIVGRDEWWLWFVNSWKPNDGVGNKSRFYVTYQKLLECASMLNRRYRPLFMRHQVIQNPIYLKRKANALELLKIAKKMYPEETAETQKAIEQLSRQLRKTYPELNDELPINS